MNVALAQLRSIRYDKATNLHRVLTTIREARQCGADYVLFPELYLSGYLLGQRTREMAEPIEGPMIARIRQQAQQEQIGVVIGFPELKGERVYNAAAFIDRTGAIVGIYRKVHLFAHEKRFFSPGDTVPVFPTEHGRIGILITFDMEFPEMARILRLKGAQVLLILNANMIPYQSYQHAFLRARALENHAFVAAVNKVGLEGDTVFFGESAVIHPTGKILYQSLNNEDLAIVSINPADTAQAVGELDYLHNRRPDLYRREGLVK